MTDPGRDETEDDRAEEAPTFPFLKTWRGVYWFVFTWFVILVLALAWFTRTFTE